MGVYIDMEMPTSCDMCWALDDYGDYPRCRITEEQRGYNFPIRQKRMDNCPLVPVPPHGRLGDLDALKAKAIERSEKCGEMVNVLDKVITAYDISTAPTVIPAEEGE